MRALAGNRRIVFVETAERAPESRSGTTVVVVDTSWTPGPNDRSDIVPLRPLFGQVLERVDLYDRALELVDAWAESTGIADLLTLDGVTYWFRLRETMWRWLHERLLWHGAVAALDSSRSAESVLVPQDESAL